MSAVERMVLYEPLSLERQAKESRSVNQIFNESKPNVNLICELDDAETEVSEPSQRPISAYDMFVRMEHQRILQPPSHTSDDGKMNSSLIKPYTYSEVRSFIESEKLKQEQNICASKPPTRTRSHGKISFAEIARRVDSRWKSMSEDERGIFRDLSSRQLQHHKEELEEWNQRSASPDTYSYQSGKCDGVECEGVIEVSDLKYGGNRCSHLQSRIRSFAETIPTSPYVDCSSNKRQKPMSPIVPPRIDNTQSSNNPIANVRVSDKVEKSDDDIVAEQLMIFSQQRRNDQLRRDVENCTMFPVLSSINIMHKSDGNYQVMKDVGRDSDELANCKATLFELQHVIRDLQGQVKSQSEVIEELQSMLRKAKSETAQNQKRLHPCKFLIRGEEVPASSFSDGRQQRTLCEMITSPSLESCNQIDTPRHTKNLNQSFLRRDRSGKDIDSKPKLGLTQPALVSKGTSFKQSQLRAVVQGAECRSDCKSDTPRCKIGKPLLHPSLKEHMMKSMNDQIRNFWEVQNERSSRNFVGTAPLKCTSTSALQPRSSCLQGNVWFRSLDTSNTRNTHQS